VGEGAMAVKLVHARLDRPQTIVRTMAIAAPA
jgi:hypothetical protein